eukprot:2877883-Alexandrium_andersonii.AAC.1
MYTGDRGRLRELPLTVRKLSHQARQSSGPQRSHGPAKLGAPRQAQNSDTCAARAVHLDEKDFLMCLGSSRAELHRALEWPEGPRLEPQTQKIRIV